MIKYLKHSDIDKAKWDLCVGQSVNGLIYAYSWYLDIVSPNWEALVLDDYEAIFPLTQRKKFISYLYQPFFTQQLGLFYKNKFHQGMLDEFVSLIPKHFKFVDIQLNEANHLDELKWKVKKRKNFVLDLNKPFAVLSKNYNEGAKRNLKKSLKNSLELKSIEGDEAINFYIKHKGDVTFGVSDADYTRLKLLIKEAEKHHVVLCKGVYSAENELLATAVFFISPHRILFLNNSSSPKGKSMYAMHFLVNNIIQYFENQLMLLDFEGSDMQGIAQFNKGFGAIKQPYQRLKINRLPWYLKLLKN